jgi:hypothetical protein
MSGEDLLVWLTVWFWSLVYVGLASTRITVESLNCVACVKWDMHV